MYEEFIFVNFLHICIYKIYIIQFGETGHNTAGVMGQNTAMCDVTDQGCGTKNSSFGGTNHGCGTKYSRFDGTDQGFYDKRQLGSYSRFC